MDYLTNCLKIMDELNSKIMNNYNKFRNLEMKGFVFFHGKGVNNIYNFSEKKTLLSNILNEWNNIKTKAIEKNILDRLYIDINESIGIHFNACVNDRVEHLLDYLFDPDNKLLNFIKSSNEINYNNKNQNIDTLLFGLTKITVNGRLSRYIASVYRKNKEKYNNSMNLIDRILENIDHINSKEKKEMLRNSLHRIKNDVLEALY
jgi:hypothetical protein